MKGRVAKVVEQRMFGFIRGEDSNEYFFHRDDFNGHFQDLIEDMANKHSIDVTFTPNQSPKGLRASDITRVDGGVRMD
jgi:cold shock CspA family protein